MESYWTKYIELIQTEKIAAQATAEKCQESLERITTSLTSIIEKKPIAKEENQQKRKREMQETQGKRQKRLGFDQYGSHIKSDWEMDIQKEEEGEDTVYMNVTNKRGAKTEGVIIQSISKEELEKRWTEKEEKQEYPKTRLPEDTAMPIRSQFGQNAFQRKEMLFTLINSQYQEIGFICSYCVHAIKGNPQSLCVECKSLLQGRQQRRMSNQEDDSQSTTTFTTSNLTDEEKKQIEQMRQEKKAQQNPTPSPTQAAGRSQMPRNQASQERSMRTIPKKPGFARGGLSIRGRGRGS
jgi:hypothetical protein